MLSISGISSWARLPADTMLTGNATIKKIKSKVRFIVYPSNSFIEKELSRHNFSKLWGKVKRKTAP
jgi:hypothetical protein